MSQIQWSGGEKAGEKAGTFSRTTQKKLACNSGDLPQLKHLLDYGTSQPHRASEMKTFLLVALPCVSGFFLGLRPAPAPSAQRLARMMDPEATRDSEGSYEEYIADRASGKTAGGSIEDSAKGYEEFEKYNLDFDGGDSGGGVVGDGNTDLEDQHNSASIVRRHSQPSP
jgi:hypothetical protein